MGAYAGQGDFAELQELRAELMECIESMREAGFQLAQSESAYKIAKAKAELRMRADGMPATLIRDLVQGDEEVAALRLNRDCNQVTYDTEKERELGIKKNIDIVREQINREWAAIPITG